MNNLPPAAASETKHIQKKKELDDITVQVIQCGLIFQRAASARPSENNGLFNIPNVHGHQPEASRRPKLAENLYSHSQRLFTLSHVLQSVCIHSPPPLSFAHLSTTGALFFFFFLFGFGCLNRFDTGARHFHSSKCSQCGNAITPCVPEKLITFGEQSQPPEFMEEGSERKGAELEGVVVVVVVGARWGLKQRPE